ncbi:hypothetical protein Tco_1178753 [Tanacetum coccineum]
MNSMGVDKVVAKSDLDRTPKLKKRHHDDQDPLSNSEKEEKKKRRKDIDASKSQKDKNPTKSSKEDKAPSEPSKIDKTMNFEESVQDAEIDFNEMVDANKDPKEFNDLIGSTIDFTKFAKNYLKKDKLMKADLEGPAFALLKGNFKNNIELEYNMEQCYLALTDQID